MKNTTRQFLERLCETTPALTVCKNSIRSAYDLMYDCYSAGGKVLICGNGGSASDSEHIVGELMKGFLLPRPPTSEQREALKRVMPDEYEMFAGNLQRCLPAISLVSQSALVSAFANDVSPEMIFAQQVFGYGTKDDLLIAISTSGKSRNVVNAAKAAGAFGLTSVGLTGEAGSPLSELCTVTIQVPAQGSVPVQEYHIKAYHALCAMIENEFFGNE